jgi:Kdo2-lipid A phosphotransferase
MLNFSIKNRYFKVLMHVTILLLAIASWYIIPIGKTWRYIDTTVANIFSMPIISSTLWQKVIAITNSRYGDWIYEAIVVMAFLLPMKNEKIITKKKRYSGTIFLMLVILVVQIGVNTLICRKCLHLSRPSPSRTIEQSVDYSQYTYHHNRIFTSHSFPSDRATTLFLCTLFSFSFLSKIRFTIITSLSIILSLSRLLVGAHWLSDILFGGFSIAYVVWIFFMPTGIYGIIENYCINKIKKLYYGKRKTTST